MAGSGVTRGGTHYILVQNCTRSVFLYCFFFNILRQGVFFSLNSFIHCLWDWYSCVIWCSSIQKPRSSECEKIRALFGLGGGVCSTEVQSSYICYFLLSQKKNCLLSWDFFSYCWVAFLNLWIILAVYGWRPQVPHPYSIQNSIGMHLQLFLYIFTSPCWTHAQAESCDSSFGLIVTPLLCLCCLQKQCYRFHSLTVKLDWLCSVRTLQLLSRPRSTHCISQACRTNIYISEGWLWGMLLLVGEKASVVFTVCVWAWAFFMCVCVCVCVVQRNCTQCTGLQI